MFPAHIGRSCDETGRVGRLALIIDRFEIVAVVGKVEFDSGKVFAGGNCVNGDDNVDSVACGYGIKVAVDFDRKLEAAETGTIVITARSAAMSNTERIFFIIISSKLISKIYA